MTPFPVSTGMQQQAENYGSIKSLPPKKQGQWYCRMYFILGFSHGGSSCTVRLYSHKTSLVYKRLMKGPKSFHLDVCRRKCSVSCANFSGHGGWSSTLLAAAASASCRLLSTTVCVCLVLILYRGLKWGTARGWRSGPAAPRPVAASRRPPPGTGPEGGMHLPRKLLLQLPQTLPGGLHVPQELGYLIVLGFAQLHALHRQGCEEAEGEVWVTPGGDAEGQ